jgi:hypothetical protein
MWDAVDVEHWDVETERSFRQGGPGTRQHIALRQPCRSEVDQLARLREAINRSDVRWTGNPPGQ